jgi:hypothetical protein
MIESVVQGTIFTFLSYAAAVNLTLSIPGPPTHKVNIDIRRGFNWFQQWGNKSISNA